MHLDFSSRVSGGGGGSQPGEYPVNDRIERTQSNSHIDGRRLILSQSVTFRESFLKPDIVAGLLLERILDLWGA